MTISQKKIATVWSASVVIAYSLTFFAAPFVAVVPFGLLAVVSLAAWGLTFKF